MNNKTADQKKKLKPLRRARRWSANVPRMALRLASLLAAITVMGLMFSALQAVQTVWLRMALSLLIASGMLLMCASEGVTTGVKDAQASRSAVELEARGESLSRKEDAACYHPMKSVASAVIVFGAFLAIGLYIALTTTGYTYALQDLPTWMTGTYGARADVMAPLGAYAKTQTLAATDYLRMIARLPVMIYINLFPDPQTMSGAVDRAAPLFLLTYPLAYVIGYLYAPKANRKREKMNRRAKKVAVRKAQKSNLVSELLGEQNQVHYGQRPQTDKHKKKELV